MGMISTAGAWGWNPHKCPECGEIYNLTCEPRAWGYAYGGKLVCSYHCMRAMEKYGRERVGAMRKAQPERDRKILQWVKEGLNVEDIAYRTGLCKSSINRIIKKMRDKEARDAKEEDRAMEEEPRIEGDLSGAAAPPPLSGEAEKGETTSSGAEDPVPGETEKEETMRHIDARDWQIRQLESEKAMMQKSIDGLMEKNLELREQAKRDYREMARLKKILRTAWGMKESWQERCALMDSMERNIARINGYQDELDELAKEGGISSALRDEKDGAAADS